MDRLELLGVSMRPSGAEKGKRISHEAGARLIGIGVEAIKQFLVISSGSDKAVPCISFSISHSSTFGRAPSNVNLNPPLSRDRMNPPSTIPCSPSIFPLVKAVHPS